MKRIATGIISALVLTTAGSAFAQTSGAIAVTDLNIRSGPGPQYTVIGVIPGGETAMVGGCLDTSAWCQVTLGETTGWSSSDYLAVDVDEQAVALTTRPATVEVNTVTYEDPEGTVENQRTGQAIGATAGVLTGLAVGGPIGGIIAGGILGGAAGAAIAEPAEETVTYVTSNPVETVYVDGEVVVGAGVPSTITTYEAPQQEYRYLNLNGQTVIVDAETNTIVRVIR